MPYKRNIKRILLIIICLLLFPLITYAKEIDDNEHITQLENSLNFKYDKNKQKILENIPTIGCKAAYVIEPNTGKVLYEKNAHEKMYPASTTKILTALVTIENCKLDDIAIVSQRAIDLVPDGYSNAELRTGEKLTIKDLLCALLIPSANEAANVLAEHVSGSIEAFVEQCNQRARELGCETLHFVNANGMHDEDHYCSAYDLYLIAKECRKHDIFNEIVRNKSYTVPSTNIYPKNDRTFKNTNKLLLPGTYYYASCTGIKTGFTTQAGQCLVSSSLHNGIEIISVVLGGSINNLGLDERFYDTKKLFEFMYENYSIKQITQSGKMVATLNVGKATKNTASLDLIVDASISTIAPNDINIENVESTISIYENIIAPIKQNQVLGQITYYVDGLEYTTNIIASHSVEKFPYMIYYIIIIGIALLTLTIFAILIKKSKKHKKAIILIVIISIIIEAGCMCFIIQKEMANSKTTINTASNIETYYGDRRMKD